MTTSELKTLLDAAIAGEGVSHFGWTKLATPLSIELYRTWLNEGLHGEMDYLRAHLPDKENPAKRFPSLRSVLAFAFPYRPEHPEPRETFPLKAARVASYARGEDYHIWLRRRLRRIAERLSAASPGAHFEVHTDSTPLLERDYARQAALGWVGKNTCVIHPKHGSFFLLGEILCSEDFTADEAIAPLPDFCGTCTRCLDACPTGAFVEPRKLDARKCISYLSIETREIPPEGLREKWGDWLFGCDICQSVCPWNQKPFRPSEDEKKPLRPPDRPLAEELSWLLRTSGKQIEKAFERTALARTSGFVLKRNALIVAGNLRLAELRPEIEALLTHERLGELAAWAAGRLNLS